jgi:FMN phosphatase YigB (HAD superfamily)
MSAARKIEAVVFDVGETLIKEDRMWRQWSAYLGVANDALHAELKKVIERRGHHWEALRAFRPDLDIGAAYAEQKAAGGLSIFDRHDLYPDALECLLEPRSHGYRVGIAGNQPVQAENALRDCGFEAGFLASSASWRVEKPSPVFFEKVRQAAGVDATAIASVGDRLDNDILPAPAAGMVGVFIERGPWGGIHALWPEAALADLTIHDLSEIPNAIDRSRD